MYCEKTMNTSKIKIQLIISILLCSIGLNAQNSVDITTQITMPYSPYLTDYFVGINRLSLIVRNTTNKSLKVKIGYSVESDNGVKISSKATFLPSQPLLLGPNQTAILNSNNIQNYADTKNMDVAGFDKITFLQNGMLPDGNYNFCFRAYNYDDGTPLSPLNPFGCASIDITYPEPPILVLPENEDSLNTTNILFTWISSPQSPIGTQFKLQMTEMLLPDANPDAVMNSTSFFFYEKTILTSNYLSLPNDPPLTMGKTYAWRVIAIDPSKKVQFRNKGVSEARKFTLKKTDIISGLGKGIVSGQDSALNQNKQMQGQAKLANIDSALIQNNQKMGNQNGNNNFILGKQTNKNLDTAVIPVVKGTLNANDTLKAGQNGEFTVIANSITGSNGIYAGKGTVYINWLKARVSVEFDSISVDTTKKLILGEIVGQVDNSAPVYPQAWALEFVANLPFTNALAGNVISWVNNKFNQSIPFNGLTEYTTPVKLPLVVNFPDSNQLAITEMAFRSDKSEFNMVAAKTTPPSWGTPQLVGFKAINIKFHPSHIQTPPDRIELLEDISFGNPNNKIVFSLKKPDQNNSGCYVEWDENGFSGYGLEIEAAFTRDWMIPSPDDNNKTTATLAAVGTDWNSMILTGMLKKSEIVGTNGMTIMADSISYDMSDVANPPSITFPPNYTGETSILFRGFYMKMLQIELPDTWKTFSNAKPVVTIQNMIIDNMGLTFDAKATNVIQYPNGNVADLYASIDTVTVKMVASSLTNASIKGKIGLPACKKDSIQNPLKYVALFTNANSAKSFQLTIVPTGPIYAHLLKGTLTLAQTSNILAYVDKTKKTFDMVLNGDFAWSNLKLGPIKNVNIGFKFQNLGFNYNSVYNSFSFNAGTWSFASAQKFLANFPVTIKNIGFKTLTPQSGELIRGKLNFDVIFNLSEDIGGMSKIGIELAVQDGTNGQKFYPVYIGATLDSIAINSNLPAVKIDGSICFRNDDPVYGNGFLGELSVAFTAVGIKASALVEFGNTNYLNGNSLYRYWRVEADVLLPPPGVPFLPGIAFRGFGGGAFYNMEAFQAASALTPSGKKFTFKPKKSNMGLRVAATIATTPKEETFNADVGLLAQFSQAQGLTYIAFTGDFWVGSSFAQRPKAEISGTVGVSYNFPDKHFNLSASVNVNASPITTPSPANLVLDINGKTNKWYFKFGEPANLNTVNVFGISLYEYLMFGNNISAPSGFTPTFKNGYYGVFHNDPGMTVTTSGVSGNTNTATGRGLALGIGFKFNKQVDFNLIGAYYASLGLGAGAELNLSFAEYLGQNCENPSQRIGLNGWQANGSIGFYAYVNASVKKGGSTWNVADIRAGGWLQGKFPNPVYVAGDVQGDVKIGHFTTTQHICDNYYNNWHDFGCSTCTHLIHHYLVNTSFNKSFEYGTNCGGISPAGNGPNVAQGDAAGDQSQLLIQYVHPAMTYNFPVSEPLAVKYGLIPDNVFDVSEQQSDGSVKTRTFKMVVTTNLKIHNDDDSYTNLTVNKTENNLGEFLFAVPAPKIINIGSPPVVNQAAPKKNAAPNVSVNTNTNGPKSQGIAIVSGIETIVYPPPVPPPGYDNLPPEAPEVVNYLTVNKNYAFIVSATLKEYVSNNWIDAKNKNNVAVAQTVTKAFRTGPQFVVVAAAGPKNNQINQNK